MRALFSVPMLLLLFAGPAWAGDPPATLEPDAQSAVLSGGTLALKSVLLPKKITHRVDIARVDDTRLGTGFLNSDFPYSVRLAPGPHAIEVVYRDSQTPAIGRFLLDAEAGKSYRVHVDYVDFEVRQWYLEDATTGQPVGRIDPGEAYDKVVAGARTQYPAAPAGGALLAWDALSSAFGSGKKPRLDLSLLDGHKEYRPGSLLYSVPLAPGKHKATFAYVVQGSALVTDLEFTAAAGKTYAAKARLDASTAHLRIEDAATGEAVAEGDSTPPRIHTPTQSPLLVLIPVDATVCPLGTKCEAPPAEAARP
jgi:hypothetical protein